MIFTCGDLSRQLAKIKIKIPKIPRNPRSGATQSPSPPRSGEGGGGPPPLDPRGRGPLPPDQRGGSAAAIESMRGSTVMRLLHPPPSSEPSTAIGRERREREEGQDACRRCRPRPPPLLQHATGRHERGEEVGRAGGRERSGGEQSACVVGERET